MFRNQTSAYYLDIKEFNHTSSFLQDFKTAVYIIYFNCQYYIFALKKCYVSAFVTVLKSELS